MKIRGKRRAFLQAFALSGNITIASQKAGCDRSMHRYWMATDPEYAREFEAASEEACDLLIEEARRRAYDGWEEPVVYQGEITYEREWSPERQQFEATGKPLAIRKYDSTLLMFLIKGLRPEVYRENYKAELVHKGIPAPLIASNAPDLSKLNDVDYQEFKRIMGLACNGSEPEVTTQ